MEEGLEEELEMANTGLESRMTEHKRPFKNT